MRIKFYLIGFLMFIGCMGAKSQEMRTQIQFVDKVAKNIPDSLTYSTDHLASYFDKKLKNDDDKVRALFVWMINNISYDFKNVYSLDVDWKNKNNSTLLSRKGICYNYAYLFKEVLSKLNIESHIVYGYTKINKKIIPDPHAWIVARVDSVWRVYDPSWGTGYVRISNNNRMLGLAYYKMKPQDAILTHMPFDPMWQLLEYPITSVEFRKSQKARQKDARYCNFMDSIVLHVQKTEIERIRSAQKRIIRNTVDNYMTLVHVKELENKAVKWQYDNVVSKYYEALNIYKDGMYHYNQFIDFRNSLFQPDKGDEYLIQLMDTINTSYQTSLNLLQEIEKPNLNILRLMRQLERSIESAMKNAKKQEEFLNKVLNTPKNYRKSLFYDKM